MWQGGMLDCGGSTATRNSMSGQNSFYSDNFIDKIIWGKLICFTISEYKPINHLIGWAGFLYFSLLHFLQSNYQLMHNSWLNNTKFDME